MAAITTPVFTQTPQMRSLNILRDLPAVADLVEKCFSDTMDSEGRRYLQQMRRAGQDNAFMRWAANAVDSVSMPLSGFVWEEHGTIVGNVSLIPYRRKKQKIYLIANVAVHPDLRRRGIGQALTQAAIRHASARHATGVWLHVRDDNPGAISLYRNLGFDELARRTSWRAKPDRNLPAHASEIVIGKRFSRDWNQQQTWLEALYPDLLTWYQPMPWQSLKPGLGPFFYRFMLDTEVQHWLARQNGRLTGLLSWVAASDQNDRLWASVPLEENGQVMTALLQHARRSLPWRKTLTMDFPAGHFVQAIQAAGFEEQRTLLWMKLRTENLVDN
jgi:ribosomal protein S18 acetylase RimI-like enzyme